jgi:hypothetical protein
LILGCTAVPIIACQYKLYRSCGHVASPKSADFAKEQNTKDHLVSAARSGTNVLRCANPDLNRKNKKIDRENAKIGTYYNAVYQPTGLLSYKE